MVRDNLHLAQFVIMGIEDRQQDLAPEHVEGIATVVVFFGLGNGNVLPVLLEIRPPERVSRIAEDTEVDYATTSAG
jgi:hypothetical protein